MLTGQIEGKIDEDITSLSKCMAEQGLGKITKRQHLIRSTKDIVEIRVRLCPEGTQHTLSA